MDKQDDKQERVIPKLRFPEFQTALGWENELLGNCLSYLQPTNYLVKNTNYNDAYSTPVLTAGKSFILGHTNENFGVFDKQLPVIIFDDFTTSSKFVTFPFKLKSSAAKILQSKHNYSIKFMYELMQTINYEVAAHERHWISIFSKIEIAIPPMVEEQQKIADCLSSIDELIELEEQAIAGLKQHKKGLMQQLFPVAR